MKEILLSVEFVSVTFLCLPYFYLDDRWTGFICEKMYGKKYIFIVNVSLHSIYIISFRYTDVIA